MGNQLDRITHLNYSELPTGDPSGIEKDELRVGVAYFFSDDEEDLDERGQPDKFGVKAPPGCTPCPESPSRHHHHLLHQLVLNETQFSAFRGQECIFSKVSGGPQGADLSVYAVTALPALCEPGDLLELLWLQPAPEPPAPAPHWAVYVGGGQIIHLHQGEIRQDSLYEAGAATWYRYRPLVAELVVQNACGHLGLKSEEICWTNSKIFAVCKVSPIPVEIIIYYLFVSVSKATHDRIIRVIVHHAEDMIKILTNGFILKKVYIFRALLTM
uniref:LRAT domain containing 1 n=1 Tax=Nomascus leucogenys TaxID=61853 RepID=G1RVQ5_NOMLE